MKLVLQRNGNFNITKWFALALLLIIGSCSTDELQQSNPDEEQIEEMDDPIEEEEGSEDLPTSGEVVLAENFVLEENRSFVNFVLSETEYNKFITGEGDLEMVSNKAYEHLNDDFDFIIILSVETSQPQDLFYGRSTSVSNQVEGLGGSTFDVSARYGSAGKLKSIIYMPRTEYIKSGPFLHEIAHTWANKGLIPTTVGGHWGFASTAGQLGGFDELEALGNNTYRGRLNGNNGFGTFANGGNSIPYGNLELYAMGLIGTNELESVQVAVNPSAGSSAGEFTADEITVYTAEDLINEHGVRSPSSSDSQKAFKALTVIISKSALPQGQIDAINSNLENFSRKGDPDENWGSTSNFHRATQAKATFDFKVEQVTLK